jgi:hypothetical protein
VADDQEKKEGPLDYLVNTTLSLLYPMFVSAGFLAFWTYISPSETMRAFMGIGGLLGSLLAFGYTVAAYKGVARMKRVFRFKVFVGIAIFCYLVIMFVHWVLDPDVARAYVWAECLRDFFVGPSTWSNVLMSLASGVMSFYFVSAFAIVSPVLDKVRGKTDPD